MKPFAPLIILALGACASGDVAGSKLTVADLVGNWTVTRDQRINAADTTQRLDILAPGTVITLTVSAGGVFTVRIVLPDGSTFADSGTLAVSGDTLTYNGSNDEVLVRLVLSGRTMTWRTFETELYDMNGDGTPEETYVHIIFART